jgi:hypothetical protein
MTDPSHSAAALRLQAFAIRLEGNPGLSLIDARFETIAAALVGFDEATGTPVLPAFSRWLAAQHPRYGDYWFTRTVIVNTVPNRRSKTGRLTDHESKAAVTMLLQALHSYVESLDTPTAPAQTAENASAAPCDAALNASSDISTPA